MSALEPRTALTSLPIDYDKRLMLFAGRANPGLAAKIAEKLGVSLGPVTLKTFSNGEVYCRYGESIRGADVFIVQPTCGNPGNGITANDALMELLMMIDAAVGASAHRVIAVMPWFAYSRQDKKSAPREPISARLVAHMLEAAGADRVLTMDLHSGQVQGFFKKPVDHMTALFILTQYFHDLRLPDLVVVAPDVGRAKLNQKFAEKIGADLAILTKERPGPLRGRDRLPDRRRAREDGGHRRRHHRHRRNAPRRGRDRPRTRAPTRLFVAATHGIFSGDAFEKLSSIPFEQIVVTDTIPLRAEAPDNVIVLPCADLLTDSIRRIFTDGSVSEVFGGENQLF